MKTSEIVKALECHADGRRCNECPYIKKTEERDYSCSMVLCRDAAALVVSLEELAVREGKKEEDHEMQRMR